MKPYFVKIEPQSTRPTKVTPIRRSARLTKPRRSSRLAMAKGATKMHKKHKTTPSKRQNMPPTAQKKRPLVKVEDRSTNPQSIAQKKRKTIANDSTTTAPATTCTTGFSLGAIDPESNINGSIEVLDGDPCDCMLELLNGTQKDNTFCILQLIHQNVVNSRDTYVVYSRWGHTGTLGQSLQHNFYQYTDAVNLFQKRFFERTGLTWKDRYEPSIHGNYRLGQGHNGAKQQYLIDNGVKKGLRDSLEKSLSISRHKSRAVDVVDSGKQTRDLVDLKSKLQTNQANCTHHCAEEKMSDDSPPIPPVVLMGDTCNSNEVISSIIVENSDDNEESHHKIIQTHSRSKVLNRILVPIVLTITAIVLAKDHYLIPVVDYLIREHHPTTPHPVFSIAKSNENEWYNVVFDQYNITETLNATEYYHFQLLK